MSADAAEMFDKVVPAALAKHPAKAREVNAAYAFRITGEGGGEWTCDLAANPPACTRGASAAAQCTIECSSADFATLVRDPRAGMQLYMSGRLRVSGDTMLAMKLPELFALVK